MERRDTNCICPPYFKEMQCEHAVALSMFLFPAKFSVPANADVRVLRASVHPALSLSLALSRSLSFSSSFSPSPHPSFHSSIPPSLRPTLSQPLTPTDPRTHAPVLSAYPPPGRGLCRGVVGDKREGVAEGSHGLLVLRGSLGRGR